MAERFHTQHERERGFCFRNQPPLIRGVRLVARVSTPKPQRFAALGDVTDPGAARIGSRPAYFGVEFVDTPVYDGPRLGPGVEIEGPALVQEPFTVVSSPQLVGAPGVTVVGHELAEIGTGVTQAAVLDQGTA